ncbi:MAG: 30S ribosome-binding factor RbfA [Sphaerochaetaceae bacterium]|nr:30S ribosome-binding factor RbfA [Sphaerochaetaceae bacterium]MDD3163459.1 30S ribosome-binding factor RbfA [Sphaerochaetaceae bacterium]MDD4006747.1 30S ribosome-binding factor RbfA [Sphaerochaetaceae bacterium]MDD4396507.1 30S ribosome-binding factor RbfA [Sphaerochaetaceae bacterium]
MSEYSQKRLESRIVQSINTMIVQHEIKNPMLGDFVSVTEAKVSKDNAYAQVFVSCLDQKGDNLQKAVDALQHSAGFIQGRLGAVLKTRNTPKLSFVPDSSIAEGQRLNLLIDKVNGIGK